MARGRAMHALPRNLVLLAGMHLVSMTTPSAVWAQAAAPDPSRVLPGPEGPRDRVWAHVSESEDAQLRQYRDDRHAWSIVCTGSCDAGLVAGALYRVTGPGIRDSAAFRLSAATGSHIALDVQAASTVQAGAGMVLVPAGILAMITGVVVVVVGAMSEGGGSDALGEPPDHNTLAVPGWTTFGLGAAAVIGGIALLATNARTSVVQRSVSTPDGPLPPEVGWRSVPTWGEVTLDEKALPPVVGMPVWTGRF
jgi:hypothetical protein